MSLSPEANQRLTYNQCSTPLPPSPVLKLDPQLDCYHPICHQYRAFSLQDARGHLNRTRDNLEVPLRQTLCSNLISRYREYVPDDSSSSCSASEDNCDISSNTHEARVSARDHCSDSGNGFVSSRDIVSSSGHSNCTGSGSGSGSGKCKKVYEH